jgi:elongation factor 1-gamma
VKSKNQFGEQTKRHVRDCRGGFASLVDMALKIYSSLPNANAFKALIAAEYVGEKIEQVNVQLGSENKTPEFLKLNPAGKVPVLVTPQGAIFESNAIAKYVSKLRPVVELYPAKLNDQALVDQWVDFSQNEIRGYIQEWVSMRAGRTPYDKTREGAVKGKAMEGLKVLNNYLASRTYLVGQKVTIADIIVACNLLGGIQNVLTAGFLKPFPHVTRYFWTQVNQPEFKKVIGELTQATKEMPVADKPAAEAPKKEKKKEEPKPKKEAAPKPAADEEEEEAKPAPKPKNPLDLLPPSSMIMDDWKRLYSNTKAKDFREVAIKGFWEKYDPSGYSLWFCEYKYTDENKAAFMTMNKVSGFLQRMDFVRKYAFAKMAILEQKPGGPFHISGVWLFRGPEIPKQVLDESYDMELYDWKKVDISDNKQKERVNDLLEEPDLIDGKKVVEVKCFK